MHFYNSTSTLQRRVVFGLDMDGIKKIATDAAALCKSLEDTSPETEFFYEYSPESFTGTELDYALEVCNAVIAVIDPTPERPLILNLPATVEMYTPNLYADAIEWFLRHVDRRDSVVLSLHPHNDRGTAVAAAELGVLAGADRVEGTLFGNGERTGNVDVVNSRPQSLFPRASTPNSTFVTSTRPATWRSTPIACPFTCATPTSANSSTRRSPARTRTRSKRAWPLSAKSTRSWEVPYLPIDPKHTGRTYEAIIRVNSQSGKGGVAYLLQADHGLDLPRAMQVEFSKQVQELSEESGTEVTPG